MKRFFDIFFSFLGLMIVSIPLLFILFLVWFNDKSSPLYIANRVGIKGKNFKMIKIRTMIKNADANKIDSTSEDDNRITYIGSICRRFKIDELTQFLNILRGDMSFVGPRPNVRREVDIYTKEELKMLNIKPGLTDIASVVFSDEAKILSGKVDPNLSYNQLIRPGKSKLGLFYLKNNNLLVDFKLILITFISLLSRKLSLILIQKLMKQLGADDELLKIALRKEELVPSSPPGSNKIVASRNS